MQLFMSVRTSGWMSFSNRTNGYFPTLMRNSKAQKYRSLKISTKICSSSASAEWPEIKKINCETHIYVALFIFFSSLKRAMLQSSLCSLHGPCRQLSKDYGLEFLLILIVISNFWQQSWKILDTRWPLWRFTMHVSTWNVLGSCSGEI